METFEYDSIFTFTNVGTEIPEYIYIYGVGGVWVQFLDGQGARARVILVLRQCIWNTGVVSLVLPAFHDIGSLGSPPSRVVYPLGSTQVTVSRLIAGNREAELKPTTFSSLLLFRFFLSLLFS